MEKKTNNFIGYVAVLLMACLSPPLLALTDAEIEARLDEYATKIMSLEKELKAAKRSPVYEQDLGKSGKKLAKKIARIQQKMDDEAGKLRMNGFMTAAVSMSDDQFGSAYQIDDKPSFTGDSKIGLQFDYQINDKADATIQLVSRSRGKGAFGGSDSWGVSTEWAYLGYQLSDDVKVRMGKLRVPFYMYSETLDVGYSYPWVRPPTNMYQTFFNSYNGADILYNFSTGSFNHAIQFYGSGTSSLGAAASDFQFAVEIADLYGVNVTSTWGDWTARIMATTMHLDGDVIVNSQSTIADATLGFIGGTCLTDDAVTPANCSQWSLTTPLEERINYYAMGMQYDNGSLFVISELSKLETEHAALFSDNVAMYVTAGYRIGKWTPYATYEHSYDTESQAYLTANNLYGEGGTKSVYPGKGKGASLGVRYELGSGMSAKFEWNNFYDQEGFNPALGNHATFGDDVNVYTFVLDAVF